MKCSNWLLWGDVYTPGVMLRFSRGTLREMQREKRWREGVHKSGTWLVRRCQVTGHVHPWKAEKPSPNQG